MASPCRPAPYATPWRSKAALAAASGALALALLASAELALRIRLGPPPPPPAGALEQELLLHDEVLEPFFAPASDDPAQLESRRPRALPERFPRRKPPGEYRVFLIGESSAMRVDRAVLAAALLARGVARPRVVSAGMGAYDAARTKVVLDEVLGLEADAVVLLSGHNEHPMLPPPSRLGRRLRQAGARLQLVRLGARALPRPSDGALRARMERRFIAAVRAMLRRARRRGAAAVVCVLPANLRDWPPAGELPLDDADFLRAVLALRAGRSGEAREALERFVARRPDDAMGLYHLARLRSARDPELAAEGFAAALARDNPDRTTPARNAALRRLAAEEAAGLADLEAAWRPLSPASGPGWEAFSDGTHWRPDLGASAASLIADALVKDAPASTRTPLPAPAGPDARESLALALAAAAEALQASRGPSSRLSERAVAMFQHAAQSDPAALRAFLADPRSVERRLEENRWSAPLASGLAPCWWGVLAHAGEAFARAGRSADASRLWAEAARLNAGSPLVKLLTAIDHAGRGRASEALDALESIPPGARESAVADLLRERLTGTER
ncbi:MAG: hypothetical protein HY928_13950 [Elusimicrobia bacterium]|nr:hypothetical protein [Elusimicrobiota bacterium]